MDKNTIDTYDKLAKEYDDETKNFWLNFPDTIITQFAEKIGTGGKVLDVGSGPGRDALLLQDKGLKITCVDASSSMVKLCRDKGLETVKADLLSLPFEDETFDGVWAYTSLLHIRKKNIDKAILEISRVLKRGGLFGLGLIEGSGELYRESAGVKKPRWFAFYTENEILNLLKRHGFNIEYFDEFTPVSRKYLNYISRKSISDNV